MIESAAQVLLALCLVGLIAFLYMPRGATGGWATLSDAFATTERPRVFRHLGQRLFFRRIWPIWWYSGFGGGEWGTFDVELDSRGIWLLSCGPPPKQCPACLLVPWESVVRADRVGARVLLELQTKRRMWVELPPDLARLALQAL